MSRRYNRKGNCWDYRSDLEKILICITVVVLIIFLVLVVLLILHLNQDTAQPAPTCSNGAERLAEAAQITQRIDSSVDPCDDFYKFSCGSLLKNSRGDEKLGPFFVIQEKAKRQIQEMYSEPVKVDDHATVAWSKKLYRACLNESAIERDGLGAIRRVLGEVGGWPVVEGRRWNESGFGWMEASWRLRELGYFYSSFLGVQVEADPKDESRFIFKVSVPNAEEHGENLQARDKQGLMRDIASAFGAEEERVLIEMTDTYDFMLEMQKQSYLRRNDEPHRRLTVAQYQREYESINWVEFINRITGPAVKIFRDDYVLFPAPQTLQKWFDFVLSTPKRTLANYMLWKAIEEKIPYVSQLQNHTIKAKVVRDPFGDVETRPEFCIRQIRKRFVPSPIDLMYVRRYLPAKKKREVEELIQNLKVQFINLLERASWMNPTDKQIAMERVHQMRQVVGAPDNYLDDEVLDDLNIDLEQSSRGDFLGLLALADRNHESWKYNQFYNTQEESRIARWNLQTSSVIGDYFRQENVVYIPATILQDVIFDEHRSKYLNYGSMGTLMGHHFIYVFGEFVRIFDADGNVTDGWSNVFETQGECLEKQLKTFNISNIYATDLLLHQILGLKISYAAYQDWAAYHKEEAQLDGKFTPKQLFWISASAYFCQPANPLSTIFQGDTEQRILEFLVTGSLLNNQDFSRDFGCPLGAPLNPGDKCEIF